MQKYDDFGRPIYETAEEYNKAHRTGNAVRTYNNSQENVYKHRTIKKSKYRQSRAATSQTGTKKVKSVVLGIAIYFIVMSVFVIFNLLSDSNSFFEIYEENRVAEEEVVPDEYGQYLGDDITPLPESFATFSYNGQTYTLPTSYQEISQMGFTLEEEYDEMYTLPTEYEDLLILNGEDGFMTGMIRINNYTGEEIPLSEGLVDYFYIENPGTFEVDAEMTFPDFVFGDGFTFESSYEDVESYLGIPYYHYYDYSEEGNFWDSYEWAYYGEDEIHFVSITFYNGTIANIGIEKKAYEEK